MLTSASYKVHLACLEMYNLRFFVVVYKLVMMMLCCYIDGLCVYTNFHCCNSLGCLVTYTNSHLNGLRLFFNVKLKVKG